MNIPAIEVAGLRKRFGGTAALDGMTFTVWPGRVTGSARPNGAGKSTRMRVISGLDAPDAGTALIGGRPYQSLRRQRLGIAAAVEFRAATPGRETR
jgi:ABC-2 type transport system ATP-binding protein